MDEDDDGHITMSGSVIGIIVGNNKFISHFFDNLQFTM
jgi:hypothetical protein